MHYVYKNILPLKQCVCDIVPQSYSGFFDLQFIYL